MYLWWEDDPELPPEGERWWWRYEGDLHTSNSGWWLPNRMVPRIDQQQMGLRAPPIFTFKDDGDVFKGNKVTATGQLDPWSSPPGQLPPSEWY